MNKVESDSECTGLCEIGIRLGDPAKDGLTAGHRARHRPSIGSTLSGEESSNFESAPASWIPFPRSLDAGAVLSLLRCTTRPRPVWHKVLMDPDRAAPGRQREGVGAVAAELPAADLLAERGGGDPIGILPRLAFRQVRGDGLRLAGLETAAGAVRDREAGERELAARNGSAGQARGQLHGGGDDRALVVGAPVGPA
jgi:hypothetical protein